MSSQNEIPGWFMLFGLKFVSILAVMSAVSGLEGRIPGFNTGIVCFFLFKVTRKMTYY